MLKSFITLIIFSLLLFSCVSRELKDQQKYDYTTSGILSDNCFQVIVSAGPDQDLKTMTDQRENAFIKAKDSISLETEKQILAYYLKNKSINIDSVSTETLKTLKDKSEIYSKQGIIEQEYFLIDNSAVLIYRIFRKDIKNEILNK